MNQPAEANIELPIQQKSLNPNHKNNPLKTPTTEYISWDQNMDI